MIIEFFIPGHCQAKQRPYVTKTGTFTPKKTERFESKVALFASQAMINKPLLTGAIKVEAVFIMERPKKHFHTRKKDFGEIKEEFINAPHVKAPDLDNLIKSLKDGCNKIVWRDDCQVNRHDTYKRFADTGDQVGCLVRIET